MTPASERFALPGNGEVHLWRLPQETAARSDFYTGGEALLSSDEQARLRAFRRPGPADRFLRGRILMRRALAKYLTVDPAEISVVVSEAGKPVLARTAGDRLAFNLSHSGSDSVLAVVGGGDLGVDIEPLFRVGKAVRISDDFFSPAERRYLDRCGDDKAEKALMLWCLKESIVKACGKSVWDGLAKMSLKIDGSRVEWPSPGSSESGCWRLAAGRFDGSCVLSVALRPPADCGPEPLRFRIFQLGGYPHTDDGFEPEVRSYDR